MINILFSSAGRRVELIRCFRKAAQQLGVACEITAIDMDPGWSPACQVADHFVRVDRCTSDRFIEQVVDICHTNDVKLIIPTIDTELLIYSQHRGVFENAGIKLHIGSEEFVRIARDKSLTAQVLRNHGIPVPRTWNPYDLLNRPQSVSFPLLLKPRDGSCSKGVEIVASIADLQEKSRNLDDCLIQEICTGREYTINCFYDRNGACVACVPHFRKFVRDGEVCFAQTERVPEFTEIAHKLSEACPGIWGCICFQGFKQADGSVRVFEINARFGGGYPICDAAGGTFARWLLMDAMGRTPDYHDDWKEGVRMLRYDAAVFTYDNH